MKNAIIVDIDGTAALGIGVHRKPYEYNQCGKDLPNLAVFINIFSFWSLFDDGVVIFLSGRENVSFPGKSERKDKCYRRAMLDDVEYPDCINLTHAWLKKQLKKMSLVAGKTGKWELFMREADDYRKDDEVKRDMFKEHVEENYFIHYVLDDRNQVVDMWRKLDLTCFQVAPGDF